MTNFKLKCLACTKVNRNHWVQTLFLCVPSNVGTFFGTPGSSCVALKDILKLSKSTLSVVYETIVISKDSHKVFCDVTGK